MFVSEPISIPVPAVKSTPVISPTFVVKPESLLNADNGISDINFHEVIETINRVHHVGCV